MTMKKENKATSVLLTKEQIDFIKDNRINLSAWVRDKIDEMIKKQAEHDARYY